MDGQPFVIETISPLDAGNKTFAYGDPHGFSLQLRGAIFSTRTLQTPDGIYRVPKDNNQARTWGFTQLPELKNK